MSSDSFVHLHTHTEFSMLDGAAKLDELMAAAVELGMPGIGMSDHGNLYGAFEFHNKARKAGLNPIIGSEIYLAPGSRFDRKLPADVERKKTDKYSHMTVMAVDQEGYRNLLSLSSLASLEGFYHKPRCFLPGQEIVTRQGMKRIEDIEVGDEVLTHKGRFRRVTELMRSLHDGPVFGVELASRYSRVTWMTGEHPVLIRKRNGEVEWVEAKDIVAGRPGTGTREESSNWNSWVCLPRVNSDAPTLSSIRTAPYITVWAPATDRPDTYVRSSKMRKDAGPTRHYSKLSFEIELDYNFGFMLGLYIAEGHIDRGKTVGWTLNEKEADLADKISTEVEKLTGRRPAVYKRKDRPELRTLNVTVSSQPLAQLIEALCGKGSAEKALPELIWDTPEAFMRGAFEGILAGDGSKSLPGVSILGQTSEKLAWQMRMLSARLHGDFTSVKRRDVVNSFDPDRPAKPLFVTHHTRPGFVRKFTHSPSDAEFVYKPVRALQQKHYRGVVYNFEVEEDHTYVTDFAVHNCDRDLLERFSKGIIATSGCVGGEVAQLIYRGQYEEAKRVAGELSEIFGKGNFFIEIMRHNIEIENTTGPQLIRLAKELNLPLLATNDLHYVKKSDAKAHDALLCIQTASNLADTDRFKFESEEFYLKSAKEMRELFRDVPEACDNTLLINERADVVIESGKRLLPEFPVPEGHTQESYLRERATIGMHRRFGEEPPKEVKDQLDYEIGVINEMGFPAYFSIVEDLIRHAKEVGIRVGPGRGCLSADSLVATPAGLLPITDVQVGTVVFDETGQEVAVTEAFIYDCDERLVEVSTDAGSVKMTSDHKVLIVPLGGRTPEWVPAEKIRLGDQVVLPKKLSKHPDLPFGAASGRTESFMTFVVTELREVAPEEKVYDFTVPTTHSYVTDSFVVHNSAAGSMLAYCLGITELDPLEHGLIFERFLNPDRVSMPDIDIDFDDRRRSEMITYSTEKYGEDHVAQIVTYGSIKAKQAIKDSARVLGLPFSSGDKLTKLMPPSVMGKDMPLADCFNPKSSRYSEASEMREAYKSDPEAKQVLDLALGLEGLKRQVGVHAAGVIISGDPLMEHVPVWRRPEDGAIITQFDMRNCEDIGLLKMDFLGLRNLTIMQDALVNIERSRGEKVVLEDLSLDDPDTYEMLRQGDSIGVFQLEGGPMRSLMRAIAPTSFADVSALIALYRPGPMGVGAHIEYAERKNGRKTVEPIHEEFRESLSDILDETYGLCVTGDTKIWDAASGKLVRIDEIEDAVKGGNFRTFSLAEDGRVETRKVTHWFRTGRKRVYAIKTKDGRTVRVSADHPLLTPDGYKTAAELQAGYDHLATSAQALRHEEVNDLTAEEARLLGYLIGDGYITLYQNSFINSSPTILEHVKELARGLFDDVHFLEIPHERNGRVYTNHLYFMASPAGTPRGTAPRGAYKNSFKMNQWLKNNLGAEEAPRSRTKIVPPTVFGASEEAVRSFLAGLWDTDGHVSGRFAFFKTVSKDLAQGVQLLFDKLGIYSQLRTEAPYQSVKHGETTPYSVYVYDPRFWEEIVPLLKNADKAAVEFNAPASRPISYRGVSQNILKEDVYAKVVVDEELPHWVRKRFRGAGTISLAAAHSYFKRQGAVVAERQTQTKASSQILRLGANTRAYLDLFPESANQFNARQNWTQIVSIEEQGIEDVFDITVEDNHNFYANGMVVHNCVYQEEVMAIAQRVAGYSLGQADLLRRAMGKKKKEILDKEFAPFRDGARKNGYSDAAITKLWETLVPFADYAFNKAHSAAYGVISYWTAYLKKHYPAEYLAAVLTSVKDDKDKTALYLNECRRLGITVLSPDVNESDLNFTPVDGNIRFGLTAVRGVGEGPASAIIRAREEKGRFESFEDYAKKVESSACNKRVIESLIKSGGFDSLGHKRLGLTLVAEEIVSAASKSKKVEASGQFDLFSTFGIEVTPPVTVPDQEWDDKALLGFEREMLGLYVSAHPLDKVDLSHESPMPIAFLSDESVHEGDEVKLAGLLTAVEHRVSKAGKHWALGRLEDKDGSIEVLFFGRTYDGYKDFIRNDEILVAVGKIDKSRDDGAKLIVTGVRAPMIAPPKGETLDDYSTMVIALNVDRPSPQLVQAVKATLKANPGSIPVEVEMPDGKRFPVPGHNCSGNYPARMQLSEISGVTEVLFI